jgi:hypothetical protein
MSTKNLPGGESRPVRKADKLTAICEPIVWKMWEPRRLNTLLASMAYFRESFTLLFWPHRKIAYFAPVYANENLCTTLPLVFITTKPLSCSYRLQDQ